MGTRYLLDTNVVVKYLQKRYPLVVLDRLTVIMEQEILISFVTHIELLCYNPANSNPEIVAYKQNASKFAYHSAYIGINNDIVLETIRTR